MSFVASARIRSLIPFFQCMVGASAVLVLCWVGLYLWRSKRKLPPGWSHYLLHTEISALEEDGDFIWAGGRAGLFQFKAATGQWLTSDKDHMTYVRAILLDPNNRLWVAHREGLSLRTGEGWKRLLSEQAPLHALCLDREGKLWVGGEKGFGYLIQDSWISMDPPGGLPAPVDALFQDDHGRMWLGSAPARGGALWMWDGQQWANITSPDPLPHPAVNDILQEPDGTLWFACGFADLGGAACLRGTSWKSVRKSDGLAGHKVRSLYRDRRNRLYFGSEYDGLTLLEQGRFRSLRPEVGWAGKEIKVMLEDRLGNLWVGHDSGLTRIEGGLPEELP